MEFSIVTFLLIMIAMALADVCWTLYFIDVEERRAHPAAFWSAMIILVTAFTVTKWKVRKEREQSSKPDEAALKKFTST